MTLEIRGLCAGYPGAQVLAGVDLSVAAGEVVALVGRSGSGKTLIARAVMGQLPAAAAVSAGEIRVSGVRVDRQPEHVLAAMRGRGMAMVAQDARAALSPVLRLGAQISDVIARHRSGGSVAQAMAAVDLPAAAAALYPHQLSGGMAQRAGLALALAARPALLVADEPTSGLDGPSARIVLDLVARAAAAGAAVLMITHDLGLVAAHAARVAVIHDGVIVECGPAAEVLERPRHPFARALRAATPALADALADLRPMDAPAPPAAGVRVQHLSGTLLLGLRDVSKSFATGTWPRRRRTAVLAGISLDLRAGECLALVGASGAGKSTLARVIARLATLDAGSIALQGQEIGRIPPVRFALHPLRHGLQMVFQDAAGSLVPGVALRRQIALPLRGQVAPEAVAARVEQAARLAQFDPGLLDRMPHELSLGQQARAGLARALAPGPAVLVLDEPTAALDATLQASVLLTLDAVRRSGTGLVLITHDLNVARLLGDRIAVLDAGRIVETGPVAQVLGAPRHPASRALVAAWPGRGPGALA